MSARWMVEVWCPDCVMYQDDLGCGAEPWSIGPFSSEQEAEEEGGRYTNDSIWRYRVLPPIAHDEGPGEVTPLPSPNTEES